MSQVIAFYILAGIVLSAAWSVVRNDNLFHAGLSLIICFVGVAGLYINLDAPFLGAMQVLIYAVEGLLVCKPIYTLEAAVSTKHYY